MEEGKGGGLSWFGFEGSVVNEKRFVELAWLVTAPKQLVLAKDRGIKLNRLHSICLPTYSMQLLPYSSITGNCFCPAVSRVRDVDQKIAKKKAIKQRMLSSPHASPFLVRSSSIPSWKSAA